MNIIEAVKVSENNQKIKRKSWVKYDSPVYYLLRKDSNNGIWIVKVDYWSENDGVITDGLRVDDYLTDDWEVVEWILLKR